MLQTFMQLSIIFSSTTETQYLAAAAQHYSTLRKLHRKAAFKN